MITKRVVYKHPKRTHAHKYGPQEGIIALMRMEVKTTTWGREEKKLVCDHKNKNFFMFFESSCWKDEIFEV